MRKRWLCCICLLIMTLAFSGCGKIKIDFLGLGGGSDSVSAKTKAGRAVQSAKQQIGKPYKWGGNSPQKGFDCSGLISWAYAQHGVRIPRTTKDQMSAGNSISKSNLRVGDIVYFKTRSGWHTGLYSGNGKFVHSPSRGKNVEENTLKTGYWESAYRGARRVVQ